MARHLSTPFRLLAWNIRAGGGVRAQKIAQSITGLQPDALILSEYRSTPPSQEIARALALAGLQHQSCTTAQVPAGRNALLIAARTPVKRVALRRYPQEPGRWRIVRLAQPNLALAGLHVPNQHTGRKPDFHAQVLALMQRWGGGPAIIAGDTNSGKIGEDEETSVFNRGTTQWFERIHAAGWRDAFRLQHGARREFTWYSPGYNNGFRLDQAFLSPQLVERLVDIRHIWLEDHDQRTRRDALSDHAAVVVDLDVAGLPGA